MELGPKCDNEQDGQARHPLDGAIQQLQPGRVDPVDILEDHQDRLLPREDLELPEHGLERHLLLLCGVRFGGEERPVGSDSKSARSGSPHWAATSARAGRRAWRAWYPTYPRGRNPAARSSCPMMG